MAQDLQQVRELLVGHLAEVEHEQASRLEAATPSGERPGFGKRAGDYVAQVVEDRTNSQLADQLAETADMIRSALAAIDRGDYGRCANCGRPIGEGRLEALPWATVCVNCKEQAERGPPPRLGSIGRGS